jgi:hypothetical protein
MNSKDIAKALEVTMRDDLAPAEHCNWDGKKFNTKGVREDGKLHELGHWAISDRKHLPDFGLGPGPDTRFEAYKKAYSKLSSEEDKDHRSSSREETLACVMEFLYAAIGGHNMLKYMEDRFFLERNGRWDRGTGSSYNSFIKEIQWLQNKNLISKSWVPVQLRKVLKKNHLQLLRAFKKMVKEIPG